MAALTPKLLLKDGEGIRFCVYRVTNVATSDTISISAEVNRVHAAQAFNATRGQAADAPAISGTTLTLDEASMSGDTLYVAVLGSAA